MPTGMARAHGVRNTWEMVTVWSVIERVAGILDDLRDGVQEEEAGSTPESGIILSG